MNRVALGIRMHSGWGVLVAVSAEGHAVDVLDRRRIVTVDASVAGLSQPYHYATNLQLQQRKLDGAERYLARCREISEELAVTAVREVVEALRARQLRIVGAGLLLASGRVLPSLEKILASHPLIHTAEGEFFRGVVRSVCEQLEIPVTAIREREVQEKAKTVFGNSASRLQRAIAMLGRTIGPPWAEDHKVAALAAALVLAQTQK